MSTDLPNNDEIRNTIVRSGKEIREFVFLPRKLHAEHKNWVPPLFRDDLAYFDRKKNLAYRYCDTLLVLCRKRGKTVGRIMGIINHRHNEAANSSNARFAFFDCIDDHRVATSLLAEVERWAQENGMRKLVGPMGMYYHDPMGFIVDGFAYTPTTATIVNFEHMPLLMAGCGYLTERNLLVYRVDLTASLPARFIALYQRISRKSSIQIKSYHTKKALRRDIYPIMSLMNHCFSNIYGYVQLDRKEMTDLANKYITVLNPRLVKVACHKDQMVGFIVGMPNLSTGLRASGGFLLPFGFFSIIRSAKKSQQLDLLVGGISRKFRGVGIDILLGHEIIETGRQLGFKIMDSNLELEENLKMRAEMHGIGGEVYKKYRIFQKKLD